MKQIILLGQLIGWITVFLFFISCGEELGKFEISVDTPVVESYITAGASEMTVKIYSMETFDEDNNLYTNPITRLNIYVNDILLQETSDGNYQLYVNSSELESGNTCTLRFEYKDKVISAATTIPFHPENLNISESIIYRDSYYGSWGMGDSIPEIVVTWEDDDNSYYQVYIKSSNQSGSQPPMGGGGFRQMMMQPFQGNTYTLKSQDMMFEGRYTLVLYKINKEYVELYERISSSDLANPVSSVDNAFGVFTALAADTITYLVVFND